MPGLELDSARALARWRQWTVPRLQHKFAALSDLFGPHDLDDLRQEIYLSFAEGRRWKLYWIASEWAYKQYGIRLQRRWRFRFQSLDAEDNKEREWRESDE